MRMNFRFPLMGSGRAEVARDPAGQTMQARPNDGQLPPRPQALARIVPFTPAGKLAPLFHLHIPRCGGASLIRFLGQVYGPDAVVTGAQDQAGCILAGRRDPVRSDCISGSIPLMRWDLLRDNAAYARVTVLRDPWARLVSHINRLIALGAEAGPDGSLTQLLAVELAGADFTTRAGLEKLRRRLPSGEGSLDNLQTRMLLTGTMSAMVKPLLARDVDRAVQELERFAVIGFCEDQLATQRAILTHTGSTVRPMPEFEGAGKGGLLSPRNELAREVLAPWIAFDQDLYRRARALASARQAV